MDVAQNQSRLLAACLELCEFATRIRGYAESLKALEEVQSRRLESLRERLASRASTESVWQTQSRQLQQVHTELADVRSQLADQKSHLQAAVTGWEASKTQLETMRADLERARSDLEAGAHSAQELQQRLTDAHAQCSALEERISDQQRSSQDERQRWAAELVLLREALEGMRGAGEVGPPVGEGYEAPAPETHRQQPSREEAPYLEPVLAGERSHARPARRDAAHEEDGEQAPSARPTPADALLGAVMQQFEILRGHPSNAPAYRKRR
ncbi:MAG: hypothetical protein HYS13_06945 [Planctomycetia bacterium]|nr:hypothetical protein [Planctomycetia bacterium]